MASIYELTDDIRFINQMMEEGEVDPEALKGALEVSKEELKIKLEHYCQFIKNLESDIDGLKMEEQRLSLKRKHLEDTKERMKAAMEWSLGEVGETKLECGTFKVSKQMNPASVKVDCELSLIPEKYLIPQEPKVDKKLLKEDIDGGVDLSGVAHLERTESLRIK